MIESLEKREQIPGCEPLCGACPHRYWTREDSLRWKEAMVRQHLPTDWNPVVKPIVDSENHRWRYRHKVGLHVRRIEGAWQWGTLRRKGWEKELVFIPHCPIHKEGINIRLREMADLLPGHLPWFAAVAGEQSLTLVLKSKPKPELRKGVEEAAAKRLDQNVSLWINWHPGAGLRMVDVRAMDLVAGPKEWKEEGLWAGPLGFRQQIPALSSHALDLTENFFEENLPLLDLFCGRGEGLVRWERYHDPVWGVELGGESVELARRNAPRARILRGRVEHRLPEIEQSLNGSEFYLYVNPPRLGCGPEVLKWILRLRPKRVAYLSCNPRTAGADVEELVGVYQPILIQPYDFFPQTKAVECLYLMTTVR